MRVRVVVGGLVLALSAQVPAAAEPSPSSETASLVLTMASSAPDRSIVPVGVAWQRSDDGAPLSGPVVLEVRRAGASTWRPLTTIDVVDGAGRADVVPRDDGDVRVRAPGTASSSEAISASQPFDNVPTTGLTLRLGQLNLPGPDKLPRSSTRARRAAEQIRRADLDVVVLNELVGPTVDAGTTWPSEFASTVRAALGSRWRLVTGTTRYNENYVVYRSDRLELVAQQPDHVVPGVGEDEATRDRTARHVTSVLLKHLRSNRPLLVAGTHLVNGDRAGARFQSEDVARAVHGRALGYPAVVAGDMNTSDRLEAFASIGLQEARRTARTKVEANRSTYTSYNATRPRSDPRWIIDQLHVPAAWSVRSWHTEVDARKGRFVTPRPSDHLLVWTEVGSGASAPGGDGRGSDAP